MSVVGSYELETVYITPVGNTYHSPLCTDAKSPVVEPVSRIEAKIIHGKEPCSRCIADDYGTHDRRLR